MERYQLRPAIALAALLLLGACNFPDEPPGNPVGTAVALTLESGYNAATAIARTPNTQSTLDIQNEPLPTTTVDASSEPSGKIVYTCQYSRLNSRNQICIINANGSGQRVLTPSGSYDNFFASVAPDGESVLFASNRTGVYQIYELDLATNDLTRLTQFSNLHAYAPEVSPDNQRIVFYVREAGGTYPSSHNIWVMNRDGSDPHAITDWPGGGWDPVWGPDSEHIQFASEVDGRPQLFVIGSDGSNPRQITDVVGIRGRNDWSPDGSLLSVYIGSTWDWDIYTFDLNGDHRIRITNGDNNLAPSFSPDGQWIAFTGYLDHPLEVFGCEIYIMRIDGSDVRRLTDNDICDWQPRWGP